MTESRVDPSQSDDDDAVGVLSSAEDEGGGAETSHESDVESGFVDGDLESGSDR